ncbi:hypothetical protein [Roseibium alexandrii]|uniref:hypothetical protein n=1 Tax=Roseibium alexandrii TaxID=388408 RepID=UPI00375107C8
MVSNTVKKTPATKMNSEQRSEQFRLFKISRFRNCYYYRGKTWPISVEGGETALVAETSMFSADAYKFDSEVEASEAAKKLNTASTSNAFWNVEPVDANLTVGGR